MNYRRMIKLIFEFEIKLVIMVLILNQREARMLKRLIQGYERRTPAKRQKRKITEGLKLKLNDKKKAAA